MPSFRSVSGTGLKLRDLRRPGVPRETQGKADLKQSGSFAQPPFPVKPSLSRQQRALPYSRR